MSKSNQEIALETYRKMDKPDNFVGHPDITSRNQNFIVSAIIEATAEKDAEIERLKAELNRVNGQLDNVLTGMDEGTVPWLNSQINQLLMKQMEREIELSKTPQNQVREFMKAFGQSCPESPAVPDLETRKLRAKLIWEEALETIEGLGIQITTEFPSTETRFEHWKELDMVAIADGLADLQYVLLGTALSCGMDLTPIFNEVHRSNMSKMWTVNELDQMPNLCTAECRASGGHDERTMVVKNASGKALKSPSYSPANLKPILEAQAK